MPSFRTHFPIRGLRHDVVVTPVEDNLFSVQLESTDAFDPDTRPGEETVASRKEPNLVVQKTKTGGWVILDEGTFDLDQDDLQALGRAIENDSGKLL
jgi:hypothetical protein